MTAIPSNNKLSRVFAPGDPRIKRAQQSGEGYIVDYSKQPYKKMEKIYK